MARKYVRFNYFEVKLVRAVDAFKKEANNEQDSLYSGADLWDMTDFLDYISIKKSKFDTNISVGDETAEMEHDSHVFDQKFQMYGIQLSKLRVTNIPSKKKIGKIKVDIMLDDDEYIGEFNSILYDSQYHAMMIQSNLYGLSIYQVEQYFSELRLRYLEEIGKPEEEKDILIVRLAPIIDPLKFKEAVDADYYRKIKIKGSDYSLDAAIDGDSLISDARRSLLKFKGANIEIIITIGSTEKTASLDGEEVREVLKEFKEMDPKFRPKIELTVKEDEETPVEVINLIEPRLTDRISVEVEPRKTIGHGYLFSLMQANYKEKKRDVRRILGITN